ncbi:uncharacterized protein EV420DRAFT_1174949 [Desarmillaria tabescens]|uniref:Nephrocystin 3-like N-terminal domain-containing protein n=1 Tax=Armillaria tabescens TaxID=1929756 RepID=A0AA39JAZ6_ARMTA|nr:uncharacterized protein EV420DRAFT_1174949 [Desarmillaria tabescens]KAK0439450.1 hypothetical protein EV420DRAFT_1174949 [Desarmillaria tabescens]
MVTVKKVLDVLAEIHPIAKLVWGIVSIGVQILKKQKDTSEQVAELYDVMVSTYREASKPDVLRTLTSLASDYEALFQQTISCIQFLEGYAQQCFLGRLIDTKTSDKVKRIRERFQKLENNLHLRVTEEVARMSIEAKKQDEIEKYIKKLEAASDSSDKLCPKSTCMKGTRVQAIGVIENWIDGRNGGTLWCRGMAGTGKSSLMATLHERFTIRASGRLVNEDAVGLDKRACAATRGACLAAFIRYDRSTARSTTADKLIYTTDTLIPTIAHSLCGMNPDIRAAIADVVKDNPSAAKMSPSSAEEQFRLLLQQPLTGIRGLENGPSLVIIIDGLDECETSKEMLSVLAKGFGPDLPFMRLIVSSRPLGYIVDAFKAAVPPITELDLDPSSEEADQDIRFYIDARFRDIYKMSPSTGFQSLCEKLRAVGNLTNQTQGLFIWAVTICNFIAELPCESRLRKLLNTQKVAIDPLTTLYRKALDAIVSENTDSMDLKKYIHDVLAFLVAFRIPVHVQTFDELVAREPDGPEPSYVLKMLGSVVQISGENMIQPVHRSFFDFLQDEEKCGAIWYVNIMQEQSAIMSRMVAIWGNDH